MHAMHAAYVVGLSARYFLACGASVPVWTMCYSGRAKIGARAKKEKEQGGGGAARWAAPPPPRSFPFFALAPIFARLESSLARDTWNACYAGKLFP